MKPDKEIDAEVAKLRKALAKPDRWNAGTRKTITSQISVLEARMTPSRVEREFYLDETDPDYRDGDNEDYFELDRTSRWMMGEKGYDAPSNGLE